MLLLYYTNTILFLLSLSKPKPNSPFTKYLNKYDIQYIPQEVCIAQCLGHESGAKTSSMDIMPNHVEALAEFNKNTTLEHCVGYCSELGTTNQNTAPIKKIHENYSLNLICRDENSLNFLINLHATNLQEDHSKQFEETNIMASTTSSSSTSSLQLSASTLISVIPDDDATTADDDADVVLFVIKIHLANETDIYKVYLSDDNFFTLEQLLPNTTYSITAFAVHSQNKYSVIALGEQFQTLRRSYTPGNITNIKVVDFREDIANPTHLSATVIWKPPQDMTCYYDIICFSPISNDFEMQPVEIRNPRNLYKYQVDNMTFSTEYKVGIRAKNIKNMKESDLFWKTFYAPSCAEWHNYNFNICAPDAPENLQYKLYYVAQNVFSLNVSWDVPTHYPDNYTLSVKDLSPLGQGYYFNISKDVTNIFIEDIEIYNPYFHVFLTASTMGGNATSLAVKTADAVIQFPEKSHFVKLFIVILAPICCVAILSLTIFMIFHRRAKLKRYQERCKYFEELEKKAPIDPKDNLDFANSLSSSKRGPTIDLHISMENEDNNALFNDDMEIDRSQLTLYEVLGEGAFGLVKRGIYKDKKCNGIVHEVAVKMLKDCPTADDVRAFRREIEVMKSVEKHPNIVGILGHCTRISNEMMLLTEYCSFGNLLDFLRDEWRFLHDIQQMRQKHISTIVDVEMPHVPERYASAVHELTGNVQRISHKTTMVPSSPPDSPAPPVPQCCKSSAKPVANSENFSSRVEELKNFKNKTQRKQPSMADEHNGGETFNMNNNEFIIEQFKRKYNDFGKQVCDSRQPEQRTDMASKMYPTMWANNVTRFKDTRGSTICKDIKTSPAAENKSYGYDGSCTNACKCNVDVIIRNIDSSDSSREQEELDRLLLNLQNTAHPPPTQIGATTIAIKNCDCGKAKSLSPPPPVMATIPSKNAVDNKSYFKFFRGNYIKTQTLQRNHSTIGSNSTTNTSVSANTGSCTSATTTTNAVGEDDNDEKDGDHDDNWPHRVPLKSGDLLDIARQVAVGMDFLSKNKVVHRDLAARNVLVAPDRTIKIADFGLSRDVYQENIYKKTGNGKLPIKWLALESLTHQVYTTQSDVWSYGILLYEIVTLGATPYPSIPTNRLLHLLKTGYRMEKPKNCGDEFYALMHACWNAVPNERPTFVEIQKKLDVLLNKSGTPTLTPTTSTKGRTRPILTLPTSQNQLFCKEKKTIHCPDVDSCDIKDVKEEQETKENDEDIYAENQESPVLRLCPDDSYLSPL